MLFIVILFSAKDNSKRRENTVKHNGSGCVGAKIEITFYRKEKL